MLVDNPDIPLLLNGHVLFCVVYIRFDCVDYEAYLHAPTCRYCNVAVFEHREAASSSPTAPGRSIKPCTFSETGRTFTKQTYFHCNTCDFSQANNKGVCVPCSVSCHAGHDLSSAIEGRSFFCDCGSDGPNCKAVAGDRKIICCKKSECQAKLVASCSKTLPCGHACYGIKNERTCLPCLHPDCEATAEALGVHQTAENECNICFCDDLGQAPCIMLNCAGENPKGARHIFHFECIKIKLEKGWNGASIDFAFLKCPLCESRIHHPACAALLAPHLQLEAKVISKAMERLKLEGLQEDKAIVSPGGRYHRQPEAFAMHHFAFYQCFVCRGPFFAGARACGAEAVDAAPIRREDLMCAGCHLGESIEKCDKHGTDWYGTAH